MEINSVVKNEIYINKCIDLLNKLCFKINNVELTSRLINMITEYKDLLEDVETSNIKNKVLIRSFIREKYELRCQNMYNYQETIGVLITLIRAINRHYNLKAKVNEK